MRSLVLGLGSALVLAAAAPAAAQGIVVPLRCHGGCPPGGRLPATLAADSVGVYASLKNGVATTYVDLVFRNPAAMVVDGAFFFPLPRDATLTEVSVYEGAELEQYNQWSGPDESRWILEVVVRDRPDAGLRAYAAENVVHVRVPSVPAHGSQRVRLVYTQPLRAEAGVFGYRYPLTAGAAAAPIQRVNLVLQVRTEAGFRDLSSPSHAVDVRWGEEGGPCPPRARCGWTNVPSRRVRVVTFQGGREAQARDFELVYTPS